MWEIVSIYESLRPIQLSNSRVGFDDIWLEFLTEICVTISIS